MMKIFIITQEDSLVIPKNMQLLADANFIDITGSCIIKSKKLTFRKKELIYLELWGFTSYQDGSYF